MVTLTDRRLVVDGVVAWDGHGFESGSLSADWLTVHGVSVDAVGFTRGSLDVTTYAGNDRVRVGATNGYIDLGSDGSFGGGVDTLTVVGTLDRDDFSVADYPPSDPFPPYLGIGVNGRSMNARNVRRSELVGLAGANTLSVSTPLTVPLYATGFAPVVNAFGNETIPTGEFLRVGLFTDPGLGQTWTGTADFGDGTSVQPFTANPDGTFLLSHTYTRRGFFTVRVTVTDSDGLVGTATFRVRVTGL